jgi:hypothetical protein
MLVEIGGGESANRCSCRKMVRMRWRNKMARHELVLRRKFGHNKSAPLIER